MFGRQWMFGAVAVVFVVAAHGGDARAEGDPGAVATAMRAVAAASPAVVEEMDAEVPTGVAAPLQRLRDALRALVEADAAEMDAKAAPAALAKRVAKELAGAGVAVGRANDKTPPAGLAPTWGHIEEIRASSPPKSGGRMVVDVIWGMPCGADTTSWVFERREGRWALALADESTKFDADNHALEVVGSAKPGDFYVFSAHTPVWCTSVWSALRYAVLAPGPTPLAPTRRFAEEASANRMCGSVQKLDARSGQVTFRYVSAKPDDPSEPVLFETKLRIDKSGVTRVGADRMVPGVPCP